MAVVIRLQGLPVVAGSADIRRFFSGLNIPDGGVHIIGGEKGEAFIIFATDEDARQGMSFSGRFIKDSRIELFLSSKTEMQNIIEVNRKRFDHGGRDAVARSRQAGSSNSGVGNLSNLVAVIKKGASLDLLEDDFHSDDSQNSDKEISKSTAHRSKEESLNRENVYVFICGMPYTASEDDVLNFFSGLQVEEVVMLASSGRPNGKALVRFATPSDAMRGVQRNREYMGGRYVEVRPADEELWFRLRRNENTGRSFERFPQSNRESSSSREHFSRKESSYISSRKLSPSRSPPRRFPAGSPSRSPPRRLLVRSRSRSPQKRLPVRSRSRSPPGRVLARTGSGSPQRRFLAHSRSRSPPRRALARSRSGSFQRTAVARSQSPLSDSSLSHLSKSKEFYVHVKNLSPAVGKRDLKVFFGMLDIPSHHITILKQDDNYEKSREAFVLFTSIREYETALSYHKESLFGQAVRILPTSKRTIMQILQSSASKRSSERHHHVKEKKQGSSGQKTCVYVRNFPFDVTNVEVLKFFEGFNIDESDVHLLYDDKGIGLGEALVRFRSEEQAQKAESLNRRRFLGTEVLLRCIPEEQMQEFGINISTMSREKGLGHPHAHARGEHFYQGDSQGPRMEGNLKDPSDDFLCSPEHFRGPPPFPDFHGEGNSGGFPERNFMPDSNFSSGSDRITLIKLKNIPFRAAPHEILDFFHGYKIIPESLSIHSNDYGLPSGEATLALVNYDEAMAAVKELTGRPFGRRKVRVTLA